MCSRCMTSLGASEHMISIASWSPRKSCITELNTLRRLQRTAAQGCSTPFGITEFDTRRRHGCRRQSARCAQRLSASLNSTLARRDRSRPARECSTPFGITEFDTQSTPSAGLIAGECSTPFGITEFDTQRRHSPSARTVGAQRLSASLNSTRGWCRAVSGTLAMCSTPFGITEFDTRRMPTRPSARLVCSTPFGITEFDTLRLGQLACRHARRAQRLSASLNSTRSRSRRCGCRLARCSTPFGITEFDTHATTATVGDRLLSAQRLSASLNSTPRHRPSIAAVDAGAQRLSASLNSTRRRQPTHVGGRHAVLNAFRHH